MTIEFLERAEKPKLAYCYTEASADGKKLPTVVFLPGFKSDMEGTKALYLEDQCKSRGQAYMRFDYSGHGVSDGEFTDGTIGSWCDDTLDLIDHVTQGPIILVGSSMGGWLSFLVATHRPDRIAGIVGIAAAPDFTLSIETGMTDDQRQEMQSNGFLSVSNDYSEDPYIFTQALVDDGRQQSFLEKGLDLNIPVRLVQGMKDDDVEWQTAHRIKNALTKADVEVFLIENGDHRLSNPNELEIIAQQVEALSG